MRTARFTSPLALPWHHGLTAAHAPATAPQEHVVRYHLAGEPVEFTFTEDVHWNHHVGRSPVDDLRETLGEWRTYRPGVSDPLVTAALRAAAMRAVPRPTL